VGFPRAALPLNGSPPGGDRHLGDADDQGHAIGNEAGGNALQFTGAFRQSAINATMRLWGIDQGAETDNPAKLHSAMFAAGLLVKDQAPHCLDRVENGRATRHQLDLLNEVYEIDGLRLRLGNMTPRQVRERVLSKLTEQQLALREQVQQIRKYIERTHFIASVNKLLANPDLAKGDVALEIDICIAVLRQLAHFAEVPLSG
jgi:hypothetical protein